MNLYEWGHKILRHAHILKSLFCSSSWSFYLFKIGRISSVKPVLWLVVNLHHVLSDGAALIHRAVDHRQAMQHRIYNHRQYIAVISRSLCIKYAPSESRWWRFTTNHRTGFTDEMHMIIAFDYLHSRSFFLYISVFPIYHYFDRLIVI